MWTKEQSKAWIEKTCGPGWLSLVEEVYEKLPPQINIVQAYQKWGLLRFDPDVQVEAFDEFLEEIEERSGKICEICGLEGSEKIVNDWVHTRCETHGSDEI